MSEAVIRADWEVQTSQLPCALSPGFPYAGCAVLDLKHLWPHAEAGGAWQVVNRGSKTRFWHFSNVKSSIWRCFEKTRKSIANLQRLYVLLSERHLSLSTMGTGIWKHMCYGKISSVLCSYHLRDFQMNRELQNTTGSLRSPSRFHVGFEKPWLLGLYGQFPHMASHRTHWKVCCPDTHPWAQTWSHLFSPVYNWHFKSLGQLNYSIPQVCLIVPLPSVSRVPVNFSHILLSRVTVGELSFVM